MANWRNNELENLVTLCEACHKDPYAPSAPGRQVGVRARGVLQPHPPGVLQPHRGDPHPRGRGRDPGKRWGQARGRRGGRRRAWARPRPRLRHREGGGPAPRPSGAQKSSPWLPPLRLPMAVAVIVWGVSVGAVAVALAAPTPVAVGVNVVSAVRAEVAAETPAASLRR